MQWIIILLFLLAFSPNIYSQDVNQVTITPNTDKRFILVTYDLRHSNSKFDPYDVYKVDLYLSQDGGISFGTRPLRYLNGNVGLNVNPGIGNEIKWFYLDEFPAFLGERLVFKVRAELNLEARYRRVNDLDGPEGALYSLIMPGWGDYRVRKRKGKKFWWKGALAYSLVGVGVYIFGRSRRNYRGYEGASTIEQGDLKLQLSQDQYKVGLGFIAAGAGLWITNVLRTFRKGAKNRKEYYRLYNRFNSN